MDSFSPITLSGGKSNYAHSLTSPPPVEQEADGLHLYIDNPRVINLPEQGCITFRFSRGPISARESFNGRPGSANVDLTLTEICDVKAEDAPEGTDPVDVVDQLFDSISEPKAETPDEGEGDEES
jgi:hypothetical protein